MFQQETPEVLVVGAGPVGLFSALALARQQVRVALIDTGIWPCTHSYALGLHPDTLRILRRYGLEEKILAKSYPVTKVGLYDRTERRAALRLDDDPRDPVCLAVARQDFLEEALEQALLEEGVKVAWRHEATRILQTPDAVEVTVDEFEKETRGYIVAHSEWVVARTRDLRVPFVIGADGYRSRVRRAAGLDFPEAGPAQYYAVFEFETDADLRREMGVVLNPGTCDVLWPLPGGACRWSFELPDYHDEAGEALQRNLAKSVAGAVPFERMKERSLADEGVDMPLLEERRLQELIQRRAPWFKGRIGRLVWRNVVRFERRLASSFGRGRLWLAGDSAHLTSPASIQSMNLGLAEADHLASAIARILRGGASLAEMENYSRQWHGTWLGLHNLDRSLVAGEAADPWVAQYASVLTPCIPGYGQTFDRLAAQLDLRLQMAAAAH